MARAIFAVGHMLPCFALLLSAAGIGLLLEDDPPALAYKLTAVGPGIYLLGTRVFLAPGNRVGGALAVGAGRYMQDHGFGERAETDRAP